MTTPPNQVQVDPLKVIANLKNRLAEEAGRSAMLEAMLQESQQRESALAHLLDTQRAEAQAAEAQEGPDKQLGLKATVTEVSQANGSRK